MNAQAVPFEGHLFDDDGYPTDEALTSLVHASRTATETLEFVGELWNDGFGTFSQCEDADGNTAVAFITGGWSGNESVLGALEGTMFHTLFWQSTHRGGRVDYAVIADQAEWLLPSLRPAADDAGNPS